MGDAKEARFSVRNCFSLFEKGCNKEEGMRKSRLAVFVAQD
jgi:hypothetical protein